MCVCEKGRESIAVRVCVWGNPNAVDAYRRVKLWCLLSSKYGVSPAGFAQGTNCFAFATSTATAVAPEHFVPG